MDQLIQLLGHIAIFAMVAYGLYWLCKKFELPQLALWICGVLLIVVALGFLTGQFPPLFSMR